MAESTVVADRVDEMDRSMENMTVCGFDLSFL